MENLEKKLEWNRKRNAKKRGSQMKKIRELESRGYVSLGDFINRLKVMQEEAEQEGHIAFVQNADGSPVDITRYQGADGMTRIVIT